MKKKTVKFIKINEKERMSILKVFYKNDWVYAVVREVRSFWTFGMWLQVEQIHHSDQFKHWDGIPTLEEACEIALNYKKQYLED